MKPVSVSRLIVEQTVEDRILELQETKKDLASRALGDEVTSRVGTLGFRQLLGLFGKLRKNEDGNLQIV
jgi:SNF2 family DNA or RNA helicase